MNRGRIVQPGLDAGRGQLLLHPVALGDLDHVEMPHREHVRRVTRKHEARDVPERFLVPERQLPALGVSGVERAQLHAQDRGLQRIEPAAVANDVVLVAPRLTVVAQAAHERQRAWIPRGHHAALAAGSEVLGRTEAEGGEIAEVAGPAPAVSGTVMTSSPSPTPAARSANVSASVPVRTDTASAAPQNSTNSRSRASTSEPPM